MRLCLKQILSSAVSPLPQRRVRLLPQPAPCRRYRRQPHRRRPPRDGQAARLVPPVLRVAPERPEDQDPHPVKTTEASKRPGPWHPDHGPGHFNIVIFRSTQSFSAFMTMLTGALCGTGPPGQEKPSGRLRQAGKSVPKRGIRDYGSLTLSDPSVRMR